MARSPGGQADLYSEVAETYGGALERLARAYEPDADSRRDLLQEIHIALWRSLAKQNEPGKTLFLYERTYRSANAFRSGELGGSFNPSTPPRRIDRNPAQNFASRSCIR